MSDEYGRVVSRCQCGQIYGEQCECIEYAEADPETEGHVLVRVVPRWRRDEALRLLGKPGMPPGYSDVLRCDSECAERLLETEGDWARVIA